MKKLNLFKDNDSHEFLPIVAEIEEEPINPLGRTMFWVIITVITFFALWLYFGKVDVVVSARGKIIPDGNIKILQPLDTGVVKNILVKEGDFVKKGQVLMEIDPSTTKPELESLKENLNYIDMESKRLSAASSGEMLILPSAPTDLAVNTQKNLFIESISGLNNQLQAKKMELSRVDEQINSTLAQKNNSIDLLNISQDKEKRLISVIDLIAKDELQKVQSEILSYQSNIKELNFKLEELEHQKKQIKQEYDYIKANFKTQNLSQLSDKQKQVTEIKANIKQITYRNKKQSIISPVDGYVNTLNIHTVGGVVTPAEKLISIVPIESPLLVQVTVLNKDIGFISEKMPVSIKIDTFDFQKYGIINGNVKKISKDSVEDQKLGPVYPVYITPVNKTLLVEGKRVNISTGMSLTADIKVGKRRIIEFFIYPMIKYWNQAISIR